MCGFERLEGKFVMLNHKGTTFGDCSKENPIGASSKTTSSTWQRLDESSKAMV